MNVFTIITHIYMYLMFFIVGLGVPHIIPNVVLTECPEERWKALVQINIGRLNPLEFNI